MEFELGSWGSGGILGNTRATGAGGGEHDGIEEGRDREVMSTEGDRGRLPEEEWELGDGESSGAGGGGRMKWKVREAICIWDLLANLKGADERNEDRRTYRLRGPYSHCQTRHHRPKRHFGP